MILKKRKNIQKRVVSVVLLLALFIPTALTSSAMDVDTFIYGSIFENDEVKMPNDKMIYTREDLKRFRDSVNKGNSYKGETLYLCEDIDFENEKFEPIGNEKNPFNGTFRSYGKDNKKISGLIIDEDSDSGLFGKIDGAYIKNIDVKALCEGKKNVGVLVGEAINSKIKNCHTEGTVRGSENVGGIIGELVNSCIENCQNQSIVTGYHKVGGIIGRSKNNIENFLLNNGAVTGYYKVGGIIGKSFKDQVKSIINKNYVQGDMHVGGIIGGAFYSQLTDCHNNDTTIQGLTDNTSNIGGIIGMGNNISCSGCYNSGLSLVKGKGDIGGIAGFLKSSRIEDSCNSGEIRGFNNVGGIVGKCEIITMKNCENYGKIKARRTYSGNFCGSISKIIFLKNFEIVNEDKKFLETLFGDIRNLKFVRYSEGLLVKKL